MKIPDVFFNIYWLLIVTATAYLIVCMLWLVAHPPRQICENRWENKAQGWVIECSSADVPCPFCPWMLLTERD